MGIAEVADAEPTTQATAAYNQSLKSLDDLSRVGMRSRPER